MSDESQTRKRIHWPALFDAALIYGGALIIVIMVTYMAADPFVRTAGIKRLQIAIVGFGLLANQIGVWHLASNMFSGRRYLALRVEVDEFIKLVRSVNSAAVAGDGARVEEVQRHMHQAVDRIVALAGKEGDADELRRSVSAP